VEIPWSAGRKLQSVIELQHRTTIPPRLNEFLESNLHADPDVFEAQAFQPINKAIKKCLNEDQGSLCVYCETHLAAENRQIDHIKPKKDHPQLAFTYTNFAHSCINDKTCGQKKKGGLLPIEPGLGCNDQFMLSTNGVQGLPCEVPNYL